MATLPKVSRANDASPPSPSSESGVTTKLKTETPTVPCTIGGFRDEMVNARDYAHPLDLGQSNAA
jgi:hypothetical protein